MDLRAARDPVTSDISNRGRLELRGAFLKLRNATFKPSNERPQDVRALLDLGSAIVKLASARTPFNRALLDLGRAIVKLASARTPFNHALLDLGSALLKQRHAPACDGNALLELGDATLRLSSAILELTLARSLSVRALLSFTNARIELTPTCL
jgi:hypothetical protein